MNTYKAEVTLLVDVEAPDRDDVDDMIEDHFGKGSGGEGVEVLAIVYTVDE